MLGTILGIAGNVAGTVVNNEMAKNREATARESNYQYNEKAADNADARARAQFNDLYSPMARLQQYRSAGLSPSQMFSGGMPSGQGQGMQGGGTNGTNPNVYGIDPVSAAQMGKTIAETKNIEADTKNKEETNKNIIQDTLLKAAQTGNMKEQVRLTRLLADYQDITNSWADLINQGNINEQNARIGNLLASTEKNWNEARTAELHNYLTEDTYQELVRSVALQNEQAAMNIEKGLAEIGFMGEQIEIMKEELNIKAYDCLIKGMTLEETKREFDQTIELSVKKYNLEAQYAGQKNARAWLDCITGNLCDLAGTAAKFAKPSVEINRTERTTSFDRKGRVTGSRETSYGSMQKGGWSF